MFTGSDDPGVTPSVGSTVVVAVMTLGATGLGLVASFFFLGFASDGAKVWLCTAMLGLDGPIGCCSTMSMATWVLVVVVVVEGSVVLGLVTTDSVWTAAAGVSLTKVLARLALGFAPSSSASLVRLRFLVCGDAIKVDGDAGVVMGMDACVTP